MADDADTGCGCVGCGCNVGCGLLVLAVLAGLAYRAFRWAAGV